jgi:predicted RND superfamily exporter protein
MINKNWRLRVEGKFEHYSNAIYRNKFKVLLLIISLVGLMASNVPNITFDTSTEGFLYKTDPQIINYNAFRNQFGRDERIIIAIKTKDIFAPEFLKTLFALHTEIESTAPYIKEVNSLKNARKTTGNLEELIVEDLFEEGIPDDAAELAAIKQFVMENAIYKNIYLSEDATFTTLVITMQTYSSIGIKHESEEELLESSFDDEVLANESIDENREFINVLETNELIDFLESIISKYQTAETQIYMAGSPIVTKNLQSSIIQDMSSFIRYVIAVIAVLLLFMFRRLSGIILPLLVVILTLATTIGTMALFGAPITALTQPLPSLLLAVGVGASVHLLAMFYKKYDEIKDKQQAIAYALGHSGLTILMTSLTTAASLASFSFSEIAPVANLGVFAAIGVTYQLILTLVFLPAMISLLPLRAKKHSVLEKPVLLDKLVHQLGVVSITYPKTIVSVAMLIIPISLFLASSMRFSHNPLYWFPEGNSVRVNTEVIDKELKGSITIEVVLDTQKENGVYEPEFLNKLEKITETIYQFKGEHYFIGKIISINDVLKEINRALNENQESAYVIPQNKDLIAQEFLLFENSGSNDLEEIVDSQFSKTRFSIKAPWVDSIEYVGLIAEIETLLNSEFEGVATVAVTGTLPILSDTITKAITSSAESYVIAFAVIIILMMLLLGSVKLGLLSMFPNLTPIMMGIAFMVIFDLPLDLFTVLIGTIAIGMVVDDTIHFMHNFNRYYVETENVDESILLTINSTGRAIFMTSIVLSSGFFVFMFANMTNLYNFGLITGVIVLFAMAADLILVGAMLKLIIKPKLPTEGRVKNG